MTSIGTWLYTKLKGQHVGTDEFGNRYYRSVRVSDGDHIGRANTERRWVLYKGKTEPSKVPAYWHGWLHFLTDDVPDSNAGIAAYSWSKPHIPNLSGTKLAYFPPAVKSKKKSSVNLPYQPWKPVK